MVTPDEIVKSRRKTISLCIMKDGRVIVRAPIKSRLEDIEKFVIQKQKWLIDKLSIINKNRNIYEDVINYKEFLYLGSKLQPIESNTKKVKLGDTRTLLIPSNLDSKKKLQLIKSWYRAEAKKIILSRSGEISKKIKLYPTSIKFTNAKSRWGSCNTKNSIAYNWRLIMLPPDIIDYVIVHELCHMVEFNHSKRFWELVTTLLPNAKVIKNNIKQYSFLLEMFK